MSVSGSAYAQLLLNDGINVADCECRHPISPLYVGIVRNDVIASKKLPHANFSKTKYP